jgi:agenet domain-containing protein
MNSVPPTSSLRPAASRAVALSLSLVSGLLLLIAPLGANAQAPTRCETELDVDALWEGYWFEATVVGVDGTRCLVHYDGYGDEDDEWLGLDRIRFLDRSAELDAGTVVEVLWTENGEWYDATVIKSRGARYRISYDDWTSEWDEWVGPERLRIPKR